MEDITPIFYSNAEKAIMESSQRLASAKQWLSFLQKHGGIKAAEDRWLRLTEWLANDLNRTVTKEELLLYVDANRIHLEEVVLSNDDRPDIRWESIMTPEYKLYEAYIDNDLDWTYIIRQDHKEDRYKVFDKHRVLLAETDSLSEAQTSVGEWLSQRIDITRNAKWTTEGLKHLKVLLLTVPEIEGWNQEDGTHYGDIAEGKVIAWIRFGETKDKEERPVLFLDEIQSKRHQEGRWRGYRTSLPEDHKDIEDYIVRVPDAPFEKQWHELALKRMLRYAVEHGYDTLAWTKGEQQSDRYDLNENADIEYIEFKPCSKQIFPALLSWHRFEAEPTVKYVSNETELFRLIGKAPAQKILNGVYRLEGDNLENVSTGMHAFYDRMLVEFANKYTKKWNGRVREIDLPIGKEGSSRVHALDITSEMRLSLLQKQPLFIEKEKKSALGIQADSPEKINRVLAALSETFKVSVHIVPTRKELPEHIIRFLAANKKKNTDTLVPGVYDPQTGRVYFVLNEIRSTEEANSVFLHEVIAHKGIEGLLGKRKAYQFYARVFDSLDRTIQKKLLQRYGNKFIAGAEYVAQVAEKNQKPALVQRIILFFKDILRSVGWNLDIRDEEIRVMLAHSRQYLQHQKIRGEQTIGQGAKRINNRNPKQFII